MSNNRQGVTIRAPRFSQGFGAYVTWDVMDITYAGHTLKAYQYPELFQRVARIINTSDDGRAASFAVTDYFARHPFED